MARSSTTGNILSFRGIVKGVLVGFIISVLLFLVYSILLAVMPISENTIPIFALLVIALSVFIAGLVAAKIAKNRGWINGVLSGILYVVILLLVGFLLKDSVGFESEWWNKLLLGIVFGFLGGMVGINL